jgi:hypothetical protein
MTTAAVTTEAATAPAAAVTTEPVNSLTALVPVRPGRAAALRATLAELPTGSASPFDAVPGTHCARFVVVDHLGEPDGPGIVVDPARLLLGVHCDGDAYVYLGALCGGLGQLTDRIFGECDGYPGRDHPTAFAVWVRSFEVAVTLPFATVDATVDRVRTAVAERARLGAFAVRTQGLAPSELRRAWREEFGW